MSKLSVVTSISLASFVMVGCGSGSGSTQSTNVVDSIDMFNKTSIIADNISVNTPITDAEKSQIRVAGKISLNSKEETLVYKTILRTGESLNDEVFGLLKDKNDQALLLEDGSQYICNGQFGGSGPDHTEFINKFGKIFMITQFECQVGAIYQSELKQDALTGELTALDLKYISQKDYHGGYVHCAGSKTPWNSFLGSEEYEPNAAKLDVVTGKIDSYYNLIAPYFGGDLLEANPYYYGWINEVAITNKNGDSSFTKHYSMGRMAHELAYVLPDQKTAYLTDDGTNDGFYMYVADKTNDLTAGTLYAAKWKQTDSSGAGKADISWIKLGSTTDAAIKTLVDSKVIFADIFESETPTETNTCPTAGFTSVNTAAGLECLKVIAGQETAAAYLETRRYAALLGATTEFRKMEGITLNPTTNKLYTAISQIAKGMEDFKKYGAEKDSYDKGGNNDITLQYNKCGAVYEHELLANIKDSTNKIINSDFVITNMNSIVAGEMKTYDENSTYANNSCDINKIASPDNVTFIKGTNTLIIGEDTGYHQNDMVWAFDVTTKKLTARIATTPFGSETTSLMYVDPINGYSYLNFVTQHPFGESDSDKVKNPDDVQSYVGYMKVGEKK